MVLEGDTEENLKVVAMYNNKLIMWDNEITLAEEWIKARNDERYHLLSKTKPTPLDESPFFSEETEGKMILNWKKSKVLGPNTPNHYLVEVARYPGENWESLAVIKKAPFNQIELHNFYSADPCHEHQFRVSVLNPHGISAASISLQTKGLHRVTRKQRIKENEELRKQTTNHMKRQRLQHGNSLPLPTEDKEMWIQGDKGHWKIIHAADYLSGRTFNSRGKLVMP